MASHSIREQALDFIEISPLQINFWQLSQLLSKYTCHLIL